MPTHSPLVRAAVPGYIDQEPLLLGPWGLPLLGLSSSSRIPLPPDLTSWLCTGALDHWHAHSGSQFPPGNLYISLLSLPRLTPSCAELQLSTEGHEGDTGIRLLVQSLHQWRLWGKGALCWEQATSWGSPWTAGPRVRCCCCARLHAFSLGVPKGEDYAHGPPGPGGNTEALHLWSDMFPNPVELPTHQVQEAWGTGARGGGQCCTLWETSFAFCQQSCAQSKGGTSLLWAPFRALLLSGLPICPSPALLSPAQM